MAKLNTPITLKEWSNASTECPLLEPAHEAIEHYLSTLKYRGWVDDKGKFHPTSSDFYDDIRLRIQVEIYRATARQWVSMADIMKSWNENTDWEDDYDYSDFGDEFTDSLSEELAEAEDTTHFFAILEGNLSCALQPIFGTWKCLDSFFKRYANGVVIPITVEKCEISDELFKDHVVGHSGIPTHKQANSNPFYEIDFVKSALDLALLWLGLEGEYIRTHALTHVNSALFLTGNLLDVPKKAVPFMNWQKQRMLKDGKSELPLELIRFLDWYSNKVEDLVKFLNTYPNFEGKLATYFTVCRIQWELKRISLDHWSGISFHTRDIRRIQAMYLNGLLALHIVDMFVALITKHGLESGLLSPGRDLDKSLADALFEQKAFVRAVEPILEGIPVVQRELKLEIEEAFSSLASTFEAWEYLLSREIVTLVNHRPLKTWSDFEIEIRTGKNKAIEELLLLNFPDSTHKTAIMHIIASHSDNNILDPTGNPQSAVVNELAAQIRKRGLRAHRNTIHGYHLRDMNLQVIRLGRGFIDPRVVLHPMLMWLALVTDPKQFVECGSLLLTP